MFLLNFAFREGAARLLRYFNTSHVSIKLAIYLIVMPVLINFNTSHVSIKPDTQREYLPFRVHFNTSHVSIKPMVSAACSNNIFKFQYIPCFY